MPTPPMLPGDRREYAFADTSDSAGFVFFVAKAGKSKARIEATMSAGDED